MQNNIVFSLINQEKDFELLRDGWYSLLENSEDVTVFQSWEWNFYWWKHYREENHDLFIVVAKIDVEIVGIAPLFLNIYKKNIHFLGGFQTDYKGFILRNQVNIETIVTAFLSYIKSCSKLFDYSIILEGIPSHFKYIHSLTEYGAFQYHKAEDFTYVQLPRSITEVKKSKFWKTAKKTEYYCRKLHQAMEVKFVVSNHLSKEEDVNAFFELHRARWNSKGSSGAIGGIEERLHTDLSQNMTDSYKIFSLKQDNVCIAAKCCFIFGDTITSYLSGFKPSLSDFRLGSILNYECIKYAINNGFAKYDFGIGNEEYKTLWHPIQSFTVTLFK